MGNIKAEKYQGLVRYKGKLCKLCHLADKMNILRETLRARWISEGRPHNITEHMLRPAGVFNTPTAYHYTVDGQPYTAKQMAAEFGVVQSTLDNHRIRKGKTAYTSDELREWRRRIEEKNAAVSASSKWARGPSEPPPFGSDLTAEQRAAMRLMAAW